MERSERSEASERVARHEQAAAHPHLARSRPHWTRPSRSVAANQADPASRGTVGSAASDGAPEQQGLRQDPDALMREMERLRRLDERKRQIPMSSPEYREAASQVETVSRRIFEIAREEDANRTSDAERRPATTDPPDPNQRG